MQKRSNQFAVPAVAFLVLTGSLFATRPAFAASESQQGQGRAIVTVLPDKNAPAPQISQQQLNVKVDGKNSQVTRWRQLGPNSPVELVILIDGAARSSLGTQMRDIQHFVQTLPPNVSAAIAYMENGRAALAGPLTTDRAQTLNGLHITGGVPGISASPYFCLSDLAQHWPSNHRAARREVVMITDGVDYYDGARHYDPEDPYLQAAITESARTQLIVYSIYWRNIGRIDRSMAADNSGQNLLAQLTQATGGNNYWEGYGNPVSLQPFFEDIDRRLSNQYELGFMAASKGKPQVESFRLKADVHGAKIDAPQQVLVVGSEMANAQ
ncbi:MAG TPA: hypothetical protein VGG26_12650 [Terracidiphilus sp.]|jgi:hypothetical protein